MFEAPQGYAPCPAMERRKRLTISGQGTTVGELWLSHSAYGFLGLAVAGGSLLNERVLWVCFSRTFLQHPAFSPHSPPPPPSEQVFRVCPDGTCLTLFWDSFAGSPGEAVECGSPPVLEAECPGICRSKTGKGGGEGIEKQAFQ